VSFSQDTTKERERENLKVGRDVHDGLDVRPQCSVWQHEPAHLLAGRLRSFGVILAIAAAGGVVVAGQYGRDLFRPVGQAEAPPPRGDDECSGPGAAQPSPRALTLAPLDQAP
jgi:hypothetical protein